MKKLLILSLTALLLAALCACSKKLNAENVNSVSEKFSSDFTAKADIRYRESGSKIELSRSGETFIMTFCADDELSGMKFTLNTSNKSGTVEYKGMTIPFEADTNTPVQVISDIFDTLKNAQDIRVWESDGCLIAAQNGEDDFFVAADINSSEIISISVPVLDLEINFDSFKYI